MTPNKAAQKTEKPPAKIVLTKFVRTPKDSALKDRYSSDFNDVYYALKKLSGKNGSGVTGTELFIELNRRVRRKDIFEILDGASWSKKLSDNRYAFYDKEHEERKRRQMDDALKKTESEFFAWLPTFLPPQVLAEVKNSYQTINSLLVQKKALPGSIAATTQIGQVEDALKQVNGVFGGKRLRWQATKLLTAYLAFLREKKNTKPAQESSPGIEIPEDWIRFDFTNAKTFERTSPVYCSVGGTAVTGKNWGQILLAVIELELVRQNPALEALYKEPLFPGRDNLPFLMKKRIIGLSYHELSNGCFVNINHNIPRLLEIIQAFCLHCGYQKDQVVLYGAPKRNAREPAVDKKPFDIKRNEREDAVDKKPLDQKRDERVNAGDKKPLDQKRDERVNAGDKKLFDMHEAVLLLDGYLETLKEGVPRAEKIRDVSEQLRRMALNRGREIDETYRNESGITFQMYSMESAYAGRTMYMPATRLFSEAVRLYKELLLHGLSGGVSRLYRRGSFGKDRRIQRRRVYSLQVRCLR